jgi:hypothetical protein
MEQRIGVLVGIGVGISLVIIFSVLHWTVSGIYESRFRQAYHVTDVAYKSALSAVGQGSAGSQAAMAEFISAWELFFNRYRLKAPPPLTSDDAWRFSMTTIDWFVRDAERRVAEGNMSAAHAALKKFGTSWYQIFDYNSASVIGFHLLEFRDIMDAALVQVGVLDYARLDVRCPELREAWRTVRNSPAYMPKNRADVFDEYLWSEKIAIDSFCNATAARDDAGVRDSAERMRQGFDDVYKRYN